MIVRANYPIYNYPRTAKLITPYHLVLDFYHRITPKEKIGLTSFIRFAKAYLRAFPNNIWVAPRRERRNMKCT